MTRTLLLSVAALALASAAHAQSPGAKVAPAASPAQVGTFSPGGVPGRLAPPGEPRDPTAGGAARVKPGVAEKGPPTESPRNGGVSGGAGGGAAGDPKPPKLDAIVGAGAISGLPGDAAAADFRPIVNPPVGGGGEAATTEGGTPIGGALGGVLGGSAGGGGPKRVGAGMTDGTSRIQAGPGGGPRTAAPAQLPPPDQRAADAARRAGPR